MAFATANVKANYLGPMNVTVGDWSGSLGDAPGTFTVKGGRIYLCQFQSFDGTSPQQVELTFGSSQSGATTTITINNNESVVNGRFIVISA